MVRSDPFWSAKLNDMMEHPKGIFLRFMDSRMPLLKISQSPSGVASGMPIENMLEILPLVTGKPSYKKVWDVRWRIFLDCTVARHSPSLCPHCSGIADGTKYRFWEYQVAVLARTQAASHWSEIISVPSYTVLIFVVSDTLIWRIPLLALHK